MKRIVLTTFFAGIVLIVGTAAGLAALWLASGVALAGGFGWMLGGLPGGPSGSDSDTGDGGGGGE
jgi:hypothetical protein